MHVEGPQILWINRQTNSFQKMYDMLEAKIGRLTRKIDFVQKKSYSYFSYLYVLCYKNHKNLHKNHHKNIVHSVLYCATVQKNKNMLELTSDQVSIVS